MYIAPGIKNTDWIKLNLNDDTSKDWERAIEILNARIVGRYLDPVHLLIDADKEQLAVERRFGFTILAIDCLLIETLQAFIDGKRDTKGQSKEMFKRFLTMRPGFKGHFTETLAKRFYEDYRCGILHQAEVWGSSIVWSVGELMIEQNGKMIINRSKFHETLKREFAAYLEELRYPNNTDLRRNFRKKMDYICKR